ncbi:S41 family peptidase [Candidatus Parcubacteria bacterium]|nr:S41 family peptidase [Candidatus Parcubacteria bacterium]
MVENTKSKKIKRIIWIILVIILLWISFGAGVYLTGKNEILKDLAAKEVVYVGKLLGKYQEVKPGTISQDIDFDLFWEVWDAIEETYVDKEDLNEKVLFYGALKGLVSSIGDPYTVFMDPKIAREFQDDLKGTFEGIGAEIGIKNDILTIIAPLPDMPAEKAGLRAGDLVLAINEESTLGISIDEAVSKIRGPKGTNVVLAIKRENEDQVREITITRGKIVVSSVRTNLRDDGIYSIKITNFNDDTQKLFNQAVRDIINNNPEGIILDLRNNPGGYLDTAIEISSEWIEDNVVVTEKYSDERMIEHLARGRARLKDFPTVVLVNQGSASASEIVSGALQDYGKAAVIGKQTFGKGSVQTLNKFDDGSSVKITVAKWLTPNKRSINDEGIMPDYEIDLTIEDYETNNDPQLDAAVALLKGEEISTSTPESADLDISTSTEDK